MVRSWWRNLVKRGARAARRKQRPMLEPLLGSLKRAAENAVSAHTPLRDSAARQNHVPASSHEHTSAWVQPHTIRVVPGSPKASSEDSPASRIPPRSIGLRSTGCGQQMPRFRTRSLGKRVEAPGPVCQAHPPENVTAFVFTTLVGP